MASITVSIRFIPALTPVGQCINEASGENVSPISSSLDLVMEILGEGRCTRNLAPLKMSKDQCQFHLYAFKVWRISGPAPGLLNQNLHFNKIGGDLLLLGSNYVHKVWGPLI